MLQECPSPLLSPARPVVLETERLMLRQPTLADVKAIARLANDRRIAVNTRRLPHPYTVDDARAFVTSLPAIRGTAFLIERDETPLGIVRIDWREADALELGYWLGVDHWGQGFATEAARAVIDDTFADVSVAQIAAGARVSNPASRRILEKCGFQWSGVELHRVLALGSSTPVDRFRLERHVWASLKQWGTATRRGG